MKLKEWIKKTEKSMKENDIMNIMYRRKLGKTTEQNWPIYKTHLQQHPLLLEADVVKEDVYESEFMSFSLKLTCTDKGVCKQYNCWIDPDQAKIALNIK